MTCNKQNFFNFLKYVNLISFILELINNKTSVIKIVVF